MALKQTILNLHSPSARRLYLGLFNNEVKDSDSLVPNIFKPEKDIIIKNEGTNDIAPSSNKSMNSYHNLNSQNNSYKESKQDSFQQEFEPERKQTDARPITVEKLVSDEDTEEDKENEIVKFNNPLNNTNAWEINQVRYRESSINLNDDFDNLKQTTLVQKNLDNLKDFQHISTDVRRSDKSIFKGNLFPVPSDMTKKSTELPQMSMVSSETMRIPTHFNQQEINNKVIFTRRKLIETKNRKSLNPTNLTKQNIKRSGSLLAAYQNKVIERLSNREADKQTEINLANENHDFDKKGKSNFSSKYSMKLHLNLYRSLWKHDKRSE